MNHSDNPMPVGSYDKQGYYEEPKSSCCGDFLVYFDRSSQLYLKWFGIVNKNALDNIFELNCRRCEKTLWKRDNRAEIEEIAATIRQKEQEERQKKLEHQNWLKNKCNRLANGTCFNLNCLERGGWKRGDIPNYNKSSCEGFEISQELKKAELIQAPRI